MNKPPPMKEKDSGIIITSSDVQKTTPIVNDFDYTQMCPRDIVIPKDGIPFGKLLTTIACPTSGIPKSFFLMNLLLEMKIKPNIIPTSETEYILKEKRWLELMK